MGAKSSGAPAPDPALTAAQIKSMGIQDSAIQQMLSNSNSLMPLQKQAMQFGLDSSQTLYNEQQQQYQYGLKQQQALSAAQDQAQSDAKTFNSAAYRQQLGDQAQADVNQAYGQAAGMADRNMARRGISPNQGQAIDAQNQLALQQAGASASAAWKVQNAARDEGYALNDRAANMLSGAGNFTSAQIGSSSQLGASGLNIVNSALGGMNSGFGAAGAMAGSMGQNAAAMYGAQGNYQIGMNNWASANDPFNTMLGAAAGMGTAYGMNYLDRRSAADGLANFMGLRE